MRDLYNRILTKVSIACLLRHASATTTGTGVDLSGYEGCAVEFYSGTIIDGTLACTIEDSDNDSTYAVVDTAAKGLLGTAPSFAITDDSVIKKVGYTGPKRYVRAKIAQSGATADTGGGTYGANIILGHARTIPI